MQLLLERGAGVNARSDGQLAPRPEHVIALIDSLHKGGLYMEEAEGDLRTALHFACAVGCEDGVSLLLENGAGVDDEDQYGLSPLHLASREGHTGVARMLLAEGARVEPTETSRRVPLHYAAEEGHEEIVSLLLDAKASPAREDNFGHTPASLASEQGHECIAGLLTGNSGPTDGDIWSGDDEEIAR